jgi:hydrogenase maturation protein HypF
MSANGLHISIEGTVQGVGFRPWVYRLAVAAGVQGEVRNGPAGVEIDAFGPDDALAEFVRRLRTEAPPAARPGRLTQDRFVAETNPGAFAIRPSAAGPGSRLSIPADLPTCGDCLRELFDPRDRRHRYPFINCTQCGPRWSILRGVPYDRPRTSMAGFGMCASCRGEYEDPLDRRFHAQPNACAGCGPRCALHGADGTRQAAVDPVARATELLRGGSIVAVKGIGGFHLVCDATSEEAVARLRSRKRRAAKPFAVMVRDLAGAERLAVLEDADRELLRRSERPIVLVARREPCSLAPSVAPDTPLLGLLLPYSPLHHLLLAETGPLVMTSGNLSDEPLAFRNEEAFDRLAGVADAFLVHDRPIEGPCDDSVARAVAGAPVLLRRSRGYVPRPIRVKSRFPRVVLACGGQLKNTFAVGVGHDVYLGPHVGDLDNLPATAFFEREVERLLDLLDVEPEVVAHDLHPAYASTAWALARPEPRVAVQHHHAHLVSAIAEHGVCGPVLGLVYDGTGYGTDGTAWGGELLRGDASGFERVATFRPLKLPGGDTAIRQVWRQSLALLDDAFDGAPPVDRLPLFRGLAEREVEAVRRVLAVPQLAPAAHGVGRLFDAVGALGLCRPQSRYEGEVALAWNAVADPRERTFYPFALDTGRRPWQVDTRPLVRAVVNDLLAGERAHAVSARFHNTVAAISITLVDAACAAWGPSPVALTGGCFANPWLAEWVSAGLAPKLRVLRHREVPPGDGGLALGQALVAQQVLP